MSFNPCSYGSSVLTCNWWATWVRLVHRFNPCSYGSSVLTVFPNCKGNGMRRVSILVLMDLPFLHDMNFVFDNNGKLFQSLFLWIFRSYVKTALLNTKC